MNQGDLASKQAEALKRLKEANDSFSDVQNDLKYRYNISHLIGTGAYGSVWRATSLLPKILPNQSDHVAVKRIKNRQNVEYCLKRTLREIKILRHFKHDNIVYLYDVLTSGDQASLYLVLDLMETDLHKIIQSPQGLSVDHVRWFLYQILRALKYLHSANVVHRDIKPSNLLVNSNCLLKLADFGMARCLNDGSERENDEGKPVLSPCDTEGQSSNGVIREMTSVSDRNGLNGKNGAAKLQATMYVATRWYRSPELILCHPEYTTSIDMWSVGCIVAELFLRRPLFPGKSQVNQLNLIISLLGYPSQSYIERINSEQIKAYVKSLPKQTSRSSFMEKIPSCNSQEAMDLMQRLLIWEPNSRLPSELALAHPFLKPHYRPAEEPICCRKYDYAYENSLANCDQLNSAIKTEIEKLAEVRRRLSKMMKKRDDFQLVIRNETCIEVKEERFDDLICQETIDQKSEYQLTGDDLGRREQSLDVKAKLRAAILSDAWRSKGQRRTRTGRPKNSSKVTKKKIEETRNAAYSKVDAKVENHNTNDTKAQNSSLSCRFNVVSKPVIKPTTVKTPTLTKQEVISVATLKTNNAPFTVRIVTGSSNEHANRPQIVTLSFIQPKTTSSFPKAGIIPVPKFPCAEKTSTGNAFKALKDNERLPYRSISRASLIRSAQMPFRNTPAKRDTNDENKFLQTFSIPTTPKTEISNRREQNFKNEECENGNIDQIVSSSGEFDLQSGSLCKPNSSSRSDNRTTNSNAPTSRLSTIPIDHCSYPQSFKSKSPSMHEFKSDKLNWGTTIECDQKQSVHVSKSVPLMDSTDVKSKNSFELYRNSPTISDVHDLLDHDTEKMQAFLPSLYTGKQNIGSNSFKNSIQGKNSFEVNDTQMISATVGASQKSSASTVPGNANELDDLVQKMSSSSLRNDIHPFADFLDVPLSAVLTGWQKYFQTKPAIISWKTLFLNFVQSLPQVLLILVEIFSESNLVNPHL